MPNSQGDAGNQFNLSNKPKKLTEKVLFQQAFETLLVETHSKLRGRFNNAKIKLQLRANTRFYRNIELAMVCHAVSIGSIDLWEAEWRQNGGRCKKGFGESLQLDSNSLDAKGRREMLSVSKMDSKMRFRFGFWRGLSEPKIALSPMNFESPTPFPSE